ncbi:hypothetical protein LA345_39260 (plasmid) [Burkholderia vietnamiensis]|uniref:Uncharacterized protein n=1 Tax=Burkholderia vietnamiensis (strain G4 / LMG 22486) TaxID=269482 RepID=A4JW97_BURVG|nr:conserved hypothetical protein [Burkholderia vietnamiensis G4]MCB4349840.1 hypothetical protein [Burkholderia vietnamiensis]
MSKRFEFERFDVRGCACDECDTGVTPSAEFDGEWVKAQAALDREAVLQAQIRTLEVQLKETRARALDEAAAAISDHRRAGREWVPASFWANVTNEAAARIRALKEAK